MSSDALTHALINGENHEGVVCHKSFYRKKWEKEVKENCLARKKLLDDICSISNNKCDYGEKGELCFVLFIRKTQ